jgi:hypothetical protein
MIFVSYYTAEGSYPALAHKLRASLERFGLRADIEERKPLGNWADGCRFKSQFILGMVLKHRQSVVWMDVDTEVRQYPEMLFGPHDFAIYNWIADDDHHLTGRIPHDPVATTLLCSGGVQKWGYTAPAIELLVRWISKLEAGDWTQGDDPWLDAAFNEARPPVNALWLPKAYNCMADHSVHWARVPASTIVIHHDNQPGPGSRQRHRPGA